MNSPFTNARIVSKPDFDIDHRGLEIQKKLLKLSRYRRNSYDRKWLAIWSAIVVSVWLAVVLFALIFNTLLCFNISDSVLIVLLGTTTLNVLGLSLIVLRGHFQTFEDDH
jgi:hypothetical protein